MPVWLLQEEAEADDCGRRAGPTDELRFEALLKDSSARTNVLRPRIQGYTTLRSWGTRRRSGSVGQKLQLTESEKAAGKATGPGQDVAKGLLTAQRFSGDGAIARLQEVCENSQSWTIASHRPTLDALPGSNIHAATAGGLRGHKRPASAPSTIQSNNAEVNRSRRSTADQALGRLRERDRLTPSQGVLQKQASLPARLKSPKAPMASYAQPTTSSRRKDLRLQAATPLLQSQHWPMSQHSLPHPALGHADHVSAQCGNVACENDDCARGGYIGQQPNHSQVHSDASNDDSEDSEDGQACWIEPSALPAASGHSITKGAATARRLLSLRSLSHGR
ncbi:hypothetical protein WJX74_002325 [Apatococcus lobatus]|uniref:Uncharacterized protein n=1 Tax=Apatococcus lobatus TaxID=904363 RepID=A0AAW1QU26_9CHLO